MTTSQTIPATLFLVTYNQSRFIEEAVNSAFEQNYTNLDIVISDDASSDDTYSKLEAIVAGYSGPHRIILNRNKENKGVNDHLNFVFQNLIKTQHVILQAGDDISYPGRVKEIMRYFEANPDVYALCSNSRMLNIDGDQSGTFVKKNIGSNHKRNLPEVLSFGRLFYGASAAYHMSLLEVFGPLPIEVRNEDQILPLRAALLGRVGYLDKVLLGYRQHGNNLSFWSKKMMFGYKHFLELECQDLTNQRMNWDAFLLDYDRLSYEAGCRQEIVQKIEQVSLKLYLLENLIHKRVVKLVRKYRNANKAYALLAISPFVYFLLRRYLNNRSR